MNSINNPCGHTGFESNVCEICGYPDPSKMIASLKQQIASLKCCGNCTSYYIKWRDSPKSDYGLNQGAWVGNPGHGHLFQQVAENRLCIWQASVLGVQAGKED